MMAEEEAANNAYVDKPEVLNIEPRDHPKKEHLLQWMEITVSEPEKRSANKSMQDAYTVYLVETKVMDKEMPGYGETPTSIWRRYNEFELLRNYLEVMYPAVVCPPLPEKRVSHSWQKLATDRFDPEFIERRRVGLENFLLRIASHSCLSQDKIFHGFLKQDDGWKESVHATDFYSQADSFLNKLSVSYRVKRPDERLEAVKSYSEDLQKHINAILKIRAKICDKTYELHQVHHNYGRTFLEWSRIEKDMTNGLETAGHYMEVFSKATDNLAEDEEMFAEQLKEYHTFGESLRNVCRKHELVQLEVEKAEDNLGSKTHQRDQVAQGKSSSFSLSGVKSKLFGSETPEDRERKIKQLEHEIEEAEEHLKHSVEEAKKFTESAIRDIDRFHRQKLKDLKDVFTNYAILQIDRCKNNINLWKNAKEAFEKM